MLGLQDTKAMMDHNLKEMLVTLSLEQSPMSEEKDTTLHMLQLTIHGYKSESLFLGFLHGVHRLLLL